MKSVLRKATTPRGGFCARKCSYIIVDNPDEDGTLLILEVYILSNGTLFTIIQQETTQGRIKLYVVASLASKSYNFSAQLKSTPSSTLPLKLRWSRLTYLVAYRVVDFRNGRFCSTDRLLPDSLSLSKTFGCRRSTSHLICPCPIPSFLTSTSDSGSYSKVAVQRRPLESSSCHGKSLNTCIAAATCQVSQQLTGKNLIKFSFK